MVTGSTGQHASGEGVLGLGTETWNVADGFTKINVLKILIEINLYELMAEFGRQNESEFISPEQMTENRIYGFNRMKFAIKQVTSNCMFKIEKQDRTRVSSLLNRIKEIEKVSDGIYTTYYNHITKEEKNVVNEKHFSNCLEILSDIKEQLFSILNRAGLIFRKGEETDLDEFMKTVYEG
jgi:uncharacterized protein Yka (UPF0111/DUF47 family)